MHNNSSNDTKYKNKEGRFILSQNRLVPSLASLIIASGIYLSGIGRYRFVLVYAAYSLISCGLSLLKLKSRASQFLLVGTLVALYYDVTKGPFFPVYQSNRIMIALVLMVVGDALAQFVAKRLFQRQTRGKVFVVCPSCDYDNEELIGKCKACSFSPRSVDRQGGCYQASSKRGIPSKVVRMLALGDTEEILFHMRLFPHKSVFKDGKRQIRTYFAVTNQRIILLDYLYFSKSWREKDSILIVDVVCVEGKYKKITFSPEPVLRIRTSQNEEYEIVYKRFGKYSKQISEICRLIGGINKDIAIKCQFSGAESL